MNPQSAQVSLPPAREEKGYFIFGGNDLTHQSFVFRSERANASVRVFFVILQEAICIFIDGG